MDHSICENEKNFCFFFCCIQLSLRNTHFSKHKLSISRATEHRMCSYNIVKAFHQIHCINSFEVTYKTRSGMCVSDLMWQVLYIYTKL